MRFIFLLFLIAASIGVFMVLVRPNYESLQSIRTQIASDRASLETAKKLKASREQLIADYNQIPKADLDGLKTLLPDSVDNIRLIIQIDALATKNGLSVLRNVDYKLAEEKKVATTATPAQQDAAKKPYGEFIITFQTVGQYKNFLAFLSDLEQNLRLVDVTSVDFTSPDNQQQVSNSASYKVTLSTYWLKQ